MLSSSETLGAGVALGVISVNDAAFSDLAAANTWNEITAAGVANGNPADGPQDIKIPASVLLLQAVTCYLLLSLTPKA